MTSKQTNKQTSKQKIQKLNEVDKIIGCPYLNIKIVVELYLEKVPQSSCNLCASQTAHFVIL